MNDEMINLVMLETMLIKTCKVNPDQILKASDGNEAWKMTRSHQFDIILMDLHMPVMNGFEACRNIRLGIGQETPSFQQKRIPTFIVAISASEFDI